MKTVFKSYVFSIIFLTLTALVLLLFVADAFDYYEDSVMYINYSSVGFFNSSVFEHTVYLSYFFTLCLSVVSMTIIGLAKKAIVYFRLRNIFFLVLILSIIIRWLEIAYEFKKNC